MYSSPENEHELEVMATINIQCCITCIVDRNTLKDEELVLSIKEQALLQTKQYIEESLNKRNIYVSNIIIENE
jgi:hypothetical protein